MKALVLLIHFAVVVAALDAPSTRDAVEKLAKYGFRGEPYAIPIFGFKPIDSLSNMTLSLPYRMYDITPKTLSEFKRTGQVSSLVDSGRFELLHYIVYFNGVPRAHYQMYRNGTEWEFGGMWCPAGIAAFHNLLKTYPNPLILRVYPTAKFYYQLPGHPTKLTEIPIDSLASLGSHASVDSVRIVLGNQKDADETVTAIEAELSALEE